MHAVPVPRPSAPAVNDFPCNDHQAVPAIACKADEFIYPTRFGDGGLESRSSRVTWNDQMIVIPVEPVKSEEFKDIIVMIKRLNSNSSRRGGEVCDESFQDPNRIPENVIEDTVFFAKEKTTFDEAMAVARAHRMALITQGKAHLPWPVIWVEDDYSITFQTGETLWRAMERSS